VVCSDSLFLRVCTAWQPFCKKNKTLRHTQTASQSQQRLNTAWRSAATSWRMSAQLLQETFRTWLYQHGPQPPLETNLPPLIICASAGGLRSELHGVTVGGLETETFKLCTGDPNPKVTVLPILSPGGVVFCAACARWKACYPLWLSFWTTFNIPSFFAQYSCNTILFTETDHYKN
jgi:hypothetical protein